MLEPEKPETTDANPSDGQAVDPAGAAAQRGDPAHTGEPSFDESLVEKVAALIDNARNYAEAELGFQKTRAALTGRNAAVALVFVVVAVVLLHVAVIALAVGFVIALAPLVTIWGAIAIVVGVLLLATGVLVWRAVARVQRVAAMFDSANTKPAPERQAAPQEAAP